MSRASPVRTSSQSTFETLENFDEIAGVLYLCCGRLDWR
jgi:hypothetical protein